MKLCANIQVSHEAKMIAKGILAGNKDYLLDSHVRFLERISKRNLTWGGILKTEIEDVKHIRKYRNECLIGRAKL